MSSIEALGLSLVGSISQETSLSGVLSGESGLSGELSSVKEHNAYTGDYQVTPCAFSAQTLNTANKVMDDDIVVLPVPYWETGNTSNGSTAYIAKGVQNVN